MDETKRAVRKVRKGGRVKIGGVWYRPNEKWEKYDGRLDGLVYLFSRFRDYGELGDGINGYRPFVACWGLYENARAGDDIVPDPKEFPDGTLPWVWWDAELVNSVERLA